jgi:hypothetical protein
MVNNSTNINKTNDHLLPELIKLKAIKMERFKLFLCDIFEKLKYKIHVYYTVWTILKSNIKIVERGKVDTLTHTHTRPLTFSLGAGTSIKSGGVKLVLWVQFLIVYFLLRSNKNVDTESVNFQKHLKLDFWLFKKNLKAIKMERFKLFLCDIFEKLKYKIHVY